MITHRVQAQHCQVFARDLDDVLRLNAVLLPGSDANSNACNQEAAAEWVARAILTQAHVRSLLSNALVRVSIPTIKQPALLEGNTYVMAANAAAARGVGVADGDASSPNAVGGLSATMTHRVGHIVALLPRPGVTCVENKAEATMDAEELQRQWLLTVHLGECVEVFPLRFVSNAVFSDEEHDVYVQTALGTSQPRSSRLSSSDLCLTPLSTEQVEAVKVNVMALREAANATLRSDQPQSQKMRQRATTSPSTGSAVSLRNGGKRHREQEEGNADKGVHATEFNEESEALRKVLGGSEASQAILIARLRQQVQAQGEQLQRMRDAHQKKDTAVTEALQQQRYAEQEFAAERTEWKDKLREEAKARERSMQESADKVAALEALQQQAGEKMKRLVEMTRRYKRVHDEVGRLLGVTGKTPDEVLELLRRKASL